MCVRTIIDASAFRHVIEPTRDSAGDQLRSWIVRGDGVVVYNPDHTGYAEELRRYTAVQDLLRDYSQRGLAIEVDAVSIRASRDQIPDRPVRRCNDEDVDILALAMAGQATVLFAVDRPLRTDFANNQVLGNVGRLRRRSVPSLVDELPGDTTHARRRRDFLARRRCPSSS